MKIKLGKVFSILAQVALALPAIVEAATPIIKMVRPVTKDADSTKSPGSIA
ncbi:hypothetical protein [Sphingomonas crusticola]|uniref:hypothetical protein n=1 Tax=Sphingomonas crusticola TaxID=1697973 RepID=UPI0013C3708A|nr:hypothetical protein [Sphingomonas crusticola]